MNRLTITIIISIGLHLGLVFYYIKQSQPATTVVASYAVGQQFNVAILANPDKPAPESEQEPQKPKSNYSTKLAVEQQPEPARQIENHLSADEKLKTKQTRQVAAADSSREHADVDNHMIQYLNTEFRLRFKYPLVARKRGWQGKVIVGLNVSQQGRITQVAVRQSSGYGILDRNAVNTFKAIQHISPAIQNTLYRDHQITIPVIYQLTGG